MTEFKLRSQEEILARIETKRGDTLGWAFEVLAEALTFENAKPFLKEEVSEADWEGLNTVDAVVGRAKEYLDFAVRKASDHRGISAERSTVKLAEYAWLLGRDDVVTAMDAAGYAQYGAPKVKAYGVGMGFWSAEHDSDQDFARMAQGELCSPDCEEGCGR